MLSSERKKPLAIIARSRIRMSRSSMRFSLLENKARCSSVSGSLETFLVGDPEVEVRLKLGGVVDVRRESGIITECDKRVKPG